MMMMILSDDDDDDDIGTSHISNVRPSCCSLRRQRHPQQQQYHDIVDGSDPLDGPQRHSHELFLELVELECQRKMNSTIYCSDCKDQNRKN